MAALNNSFGFGGHNVSLVFTAAYSRPGDSLRHRKELT